MQQKKIEIFFNDTISISKLILVGRNMILAGIDPPEVKKYPQNDVKKKRHIIVFWVLPIPLNQRFSQRDKGKSYLSDLFT